MENSGFTDHSSSGLSAAVQSGVNAKMNGQEPLLSYREYAKLFSKVL